MKGLVNEKFDVIAVCPSGDVSNCFKEYSIKHIHWNCIRDNKNPIHEMRSILNLAGIFRKLSPDLVHSFTVRPNVYSAYALRLSRRKSVLLSSVLGLGHYYIDHREASHRFKRMVINNLYRSAFLRSGKVIFLNHDDHDLFINTKIISRNKAKIIHGDGVNLDFFKPASKEMYDTVVNILMVARLIREKGVLEYCQAAERLRERHGDKVRFSIIGDIDKGNPSHLSWKELDYFKEKGVVVFLGRIDEPQPYFADSDIYCLPSYREGLPMSVLEGMASGLPVVTTNAPGCRETIDDGVSGFLVPVRDVDALVDRLERLILDPDLRRRMGAAARAKAEREFGVDAIVEQHLQLYEEVLANRRNP